MNMSQSASYLLEKKSRWRCTSFRDQERTAVHNLYTG